MTDSPDLLTVDEYTRRIGQLRKLDAAIEVLVEDSTELMQQAGIKLVKVLTDSAGEFSIGLAEFARYVEQNSVDKSRKYYADTVYAAVGRYLTSPDSETGIKYLTHLDYEIKKLVECLTPPVPEAVVVVEEDTSEVDAEAIRNAVYDDALASGLSDAEARETAWPQGVETDSHATQDDDKIKLFVARD